jgi:hypothetical protein
MNRFGSKTEAERHVESERLTQSRGTFCVDSISPWRRGFVSPSIGEVFQAIAQNEMT